MAEINQIYKCSICGNIAEIVHAGEGSLVCCNQKMILQEPNTVDASREKHVPVIEKTATGARVRIGSVPHPMEAAHYIEWVEIIIDNQVSRKYLKPGDAPEAEFCSWSENIIARAYCNLHGLWQNV